MTKNQPKNFYYEVENLTNQQKHLDKDKKINYIDDRRNTTASQKNLTKTGVGEVVSLLCPPNTTWGSK